MLILGIDPGLSGALAFYDPEHKKIIKIFDMPLVEQKSQGDHDKVTRGAKLVRAAGDIQAAKATAKGPKPQKRCIDTQALLGLIKPIAQQLHCSVVEQVSAAPGQGTVSMFRFGEGFGLLQGLLAALSVKTYLVRPVVWKPAMGLSGGKDVSLAKVRNLFPEEAGFLFPLKKHDGRAEATLLAVYGARQFFHPVHELY